MSIRTKNTVVVVLGVVVKRFCTRERAQNVGQSFDLLSASGAEVSTQIKRLIMSWLPPCPVLKQLVYTAALSVLCIGLGTVEIHLTNQRSNRGIRYANTPDIITTNRASKFITTTTVVPYRVFVQYGTNSTKHTPQTTALQSPFTVTTRPPHSRLQVTKEGLHQQAQRGRRSETPQHHPHVRKRGVQRSELRRNVSRPAQPRQQEQMREVHAIRQPGERCARWACQQPIHHPSVPAEAQKAHQQ